MKYNQRILLTLLAAFVFLSSSAWAGKQRLWGGLIVFNVPAGTSVEGTNLDGWDQAYVVVPKNKGRRVGAVIVRETLSRSDANLTTSQLADLLKKQFKEEDGLRVSKWKFNGRKQQVTGSLAGKADVPWSNREARAVGAFRVIRVYKNEVVGVLAFGAPREFGRRYANPFKQIVNTFKTPKPKPNKAKRKR